jgi:hypothetical protein
VFKPHEMEDEPCDTCGVRPSLHMGHGSYSCEPCYQAWWCPKCRFDQRHQPHVCVTKEQAAKYRAEFKEFCEEVGIEWTAEMDAAESGV